MVEKIKIGKIINTHGIKGEIKVLPLTDDLDRFNELENFYIQGEKEKFKTEKVRYNNKNNVLIKINGYDNINEVLKYKGKYILVDRKDVVDLPENSFFLFEIKGLKVYDTDNKKIGVIKDILTSSANDVYIIKDNEKEYLIPALKHIIKEVNINEGKMIIDPLEGMIE
ncbi:MAG: 16S rRNA processing protein RimM [Firmicutes bacterium]|nr:16S rRNA processing protein RimM [Bacillota bacterium]